MSRLHVVVVALALAGCPEAPGEARATWTVRDFVARAGDPGAYLGGVAPALAPDGGLASSLAVLAGAPIPFRGPPYGSGPAPVQAKGSGLPVQPAYAEGRPAGFVVTEVWDDQPLPWIQPVYQVFRAGEVKALRTVFSVDVAGSFYSPFWRAEVITAAAGTDPASVPNSASGLLDPPWPAPVESALVYCSIVPADNAVAASAGDPVDVDGAPLLVHPFTLESLGRAPARATAWVDNHKVWYLGLGLNVTPSDGQRLWATPMYFFAHAGPGGETAPLPLPPVLPDGPRTHALVQRVDVVLGAGADPQPTPFVPLDRLAAFRKAFDDQGFSFVSLKTDVDPGIDPALARKYLLRVALNPGCFGVGGGFPDACQWLDSAAHVAQRLPASALKPQPVYLAVKAAQGAP
jgi:hypothetical protein